MTKMTKKQEEKKKNCVLINRRQEVESGAVLDLEEAAAPADWLSVCLPSPRPPPVCLTLFHRSPSSDALFQETTQTPPLPSPMAAAADLNPSAVTPRSFLASLSVYIEQTISNDLQF